MKKRIIALLLVCLMVVSAVPAWAGAEEAPTAASEAAACPGKGETHTLENCPDAEVVSEQKEPTCVAWGWAVYRCPVCEDVFADEFGAPTGAHTWEETTPKKDATCTESGTEAVYTCSVCETTTGGGTISALGHDWKVEETKGDCETGGTVKKVCNRCGSTMTEQFEPGREGHIWDTTPTEFTAPTCTQEGSATYTCLICGQTKKVPVKTTAHDFQLVEYKGSTCTEAGCQAYYQCADCKLIVSYGFPTWRYNEQYLESDYDGSRWQTYTNMVESYKTTLEDLKIDALGHYSPDADCVKGGKCVRCDVIVPPLGHTFTDEDGNYLYPAPWLDKEATCEEPGYKAYVCTRCNGTLEGGEVHVPTAPNGHVSYEDSSDPNKGWLVAHECGKVGGKRTWKCDHCGKILTDSPDKDHKLVTVVVPATDCKTAGYTYTYCAYKIDAEGEHKNDVLCEVKAVTEWTPTGSKEAIQLKDENGEYLTEPRRVVSFTLGKALEHQATLNPPTCTTDGKCDWCDKVFPKTGHDWLKEEGELPTCTKDGKEATWTCKNCGELHDVWNGTPIKATGHHAGTEVEYKDSTCTEPGNYHYYVCTECGKPCQYDGDTSDYDPTIPATGHWFYSTDSVGATCTTAGYHTATCGYCGIEYIFGYTAPYNHEQYGESTWQKVTGEDHDPTSKDATCEEDGLLVEECYLCHAVRTEIIPATGHHNAAGELLVDDCLNHVTPDKDGKEDRVCKDCEKKIGQTHHNLKETTVERTCKQDGYHLIVCENCNEVLVEEIELAPTDGSHLDPDFGVKWTAESKETCENGGTYYSVCQVCGERKEKTEPATGHKWDDNGWTDVEGQEATHTHGGKQERSCLNGCGEKQTRDTAPIPGFDYDLTVDNAVASGAGFTDSSLVAVTVSLKSAGVDVNSLRFNLKYDADIVKFVKAEFDADTPFISAQRATDHAKEGYVSVIAVVPNDEQSKAANTTLSNVEGDVLVTLYFRINSDTAKSTTFSIGTHAEIVENQAINNAGEDVDFCGDAETIAIGLILDLNGDGSRDLKDALIVLKMINRELQGEEGVLVTYNVAADVDKNGDVDASDLEVIYDYLTGAVTYEEVVALGTK